MELDRYRTATAQHCGELCEELEKFGFDRLHDLCLEVGADKMRRYIEENQEPLLLYVRASPSQRKRMGRRIDPDNRALLVLAALYVARTAWNVLTALCDRLVVAGGPYRDLTGRAAEAAHSIRSEWPTIWPFDDGRDPFGEMV